MSRRMKVVVTGLVLVFVFTLALYAYHGHTSLSRRQSHNGEDPRTPGYSMVLLDSGQLFFGKLTTQGSSFPELSDIYYIRVETDPSTKQQKSILLKRGEEW